MDKYTKLVCIKDYKSLFKNEFVYMNQNDMYRYGEFIHLFRLNTHLGIYILLTELTNYFVTIEEYRELQLNKILNE